MRSCKRGKVTSSRRQVTRPPRTKPEARLLAHSTTCCSTGHHNDAQEQSPSHATPESGVRSILNAVPNRAILTPDGHPHVRASSLSAQVAAIL